MRNRLVCNVEIKFPLTPSFSSQRGAGEQTSGKIGTSNFLILIQPKVLCNFYISLLQVIALLRRNTGTEPRPGF